MAASPFCATDTVPLIFARMDIALSNEEKMVLKKVAKAASALHFPVFLVGGFVRDALLGRPTKDMDFVCVGDAEALALKTAEQFFSKPHVSVFKNFGTAHFTLPDGWDMEFVGARKESYAQHSRNPQVAPGTIEDDQNRRDFTINALAISLNAEDYGKLHDPFGGLEHLKKGLIKTPLAPDMTFSDDPLRMMRAVRFATQLGFTIDGETFEAIQRAASRISIVSQERITDELNKIVLSPKPSVGFKLLSEAGLLPIIFPQFMALKGAAFVDGYGHKDNFHHTLQVLDNVAKRSDDLWLRWAALLHDIAKPATKRFEEGHGWTFHGHEVVGGRMVPKIFAQLKLPQGEPMRLVRKLVELHLRPIGLAKEEITDSAMRRLLFDAGEDFEKLMLLCESDITSKNKQKVARYLENFELVKQRCYDVEAADQIRNWQPPVTGEMIMQAFDLKPSKNVGIIKDAIREAILDGHIPNEKDAAYTFMLQKGKELGLTPVI